MISTHKSRTVVGLDIEAGSVAAAEVTSNGSISVGTTAVTTLEPGITREGEVVDADALAAALKPMFAEHKLAKNVRMGIANQRVVVRTLRLPLIEKREEIETAIRFQAADQIPMSLEQAVLDWRVLEPDPETLLARQMDVVVVAARRETVTAMTRACHTAGLKPVGIDVAAFGMIRALADQEPAESPLAPGAYEETMAAGPGPEDGMPAAVGSPGSARLLCSLGDVTNLAVARGPRCLFSRVSSFGLETIAQRVAERRGLTLEHARQWLTFVGLSAPVESIEGDPEIVATCRDALLEGAGKLAGELRLSLDFYGNQESAVAVEEIVLCGVGTTIAGLPEHLGMELGFAIRVGTPGALSALDRPTAARLTLCYGLGLEE